MPSEAPASAPEQHDIPAAGAERTDALLNDYLNRSGTVGQARGNIQKVLTEVRGDHEAEERVGKYESSFDAAAKGHEHVKLEKMSGGKQGEDEVGTHNAKANADLFEAKNIIQHTEVTTEVLDHEDDEPTGHAGQEAGKEGLVIPKGEVVEGTEMYEGENESQQGRRHRGSEQAARAGQPEQDYGSGQRKVAPHLKVFEDYLRNGKDRVEAQAELMRGQSRQEIATTLARSNRYSEEEVQQVVALAA